MKRTKILFMGRKQVAARCLQYLAERSDVEIVGVLTDSHLAISPTTEIAREHGYQLFDFDNALDALEKKSLTFDLGISILYWRRLRDDFLSTSSKGVINFHPAPLPEYKGTAGYNLAILDQLQQWAVTAHYVDESIDTGEIIDLYSFPIDPDRETALTLERASQIKIEQQFYSVVDRAIVSDIRLYASPNIGGKYVSRAEMEAMKEIKSGDDISRKIRAFWFPPYNGAYVLIDGKKFTLVDQFILNELADETNS